MKRAASLSVTMGIPLAAASAMHLAVEISAAGNAPAADLWGFIIWWICLAASALVLRQVLRRPSKLWAMAAVCGACLLIQTILTFISPAEYGSVFAWLAVFILWAISYIICVRVALICPKAETFMYVFEICVGVLILACVMSEAEVLPLYSSVGSLMGMLAALFALAGFRRFAASDLRGDFLRVGIVAVAGALSVLITFLTTGLFSVILGNVISFGSKILSAIGRAVTAFMTWLVSLFPEESMELDLEETAQAISSSDTEGVLLSQDVKSAIMTAAVILILAAAVIGILVWIKLKGRERTAGSKKVYLASERSKKKTGGLIKLWFKHQIWYLKNRNTPEGFLIWLNRFLARRGNGRNNGESSRAFLMRAAASAPLLKADLINLASWLDIRFFSPLNPEEFAGGVVCLRKKFRRTVSAKSKTRP